MSEGSRRFTSRFTVLMAVMALDAGYTPEAIARAMYGRSVSWCGSEADMWSGVVRMYKPLLSHKDKRMQQVGELLCGWAMERCKDATECERHEAVFGQM